MKIFSVNDSLVWVPVSQATKTFSPRAFLPIDGLNAEYGYGYKGSRTVANYLDALVDIQQSFDKKTSKKFTKGNGKKETQYKGRWWHKNSNGAPALLGPKWWVELPIAKLLSINEEEISKLVKKSTGSFIPHHQYEKNGVTEISILDESDNFEETKVVDEITLTAIKSRRGQVNFRQSLLTAFNDTCCITGCSVSSVLEAAHIISHSDETNYKVTNGILLRADIHTLFDLNLIGIDQHGVVHISNELEQSEYSGYQGVVIASSLSEDTAVNFKKRFVEYIEKNSLN